MCKKLLAGLLSLVLVVSSAGLDVMAADTADGTGEEVYTVTEEVTADEEAPVEGEEAKPSDGEDEAATPDESSKEDVTADEADAGDVASDESSDEAACESDDDCEVEVPKNPVEADRADEEDMPELTPDEVDCEGTVTTIDGGTVSIKPEDKPLAVIFFSTTCGNCTQILRTLAGSTLSPDYRYIAAEMNNASKDDVVKFINDKGIASSSITYGYGAFSLAFSLYDKLGGGGSLTWPLILYVGRNGKIRSYTTGYVDVLAQIDKWLGKNSYSITYDPNGGQGEEIPETVCVMGEKYKLPQCTYEREGYVFKEWNTKADGTGTAYKAEAEVSDLTNVDGAVINLYAIWDKNEYKISYYLNGGTNDPANPAGYDVDTLPVEFKDPSKTGYKFDGWYSEATFTNRILRLSKGSSGDKTLYAKWIPVTYTVSFNGNSATGGSMSDMTCEYDKSYTLNVNKYVKKGYEFAEWNTKADGTGTAYADMAQIKNLSATQGEKITLYARWNKATYTITYNLKGGKNNAANPATYTITTKTIKLKGATRKGYSFEGWYSDSACKKKVTQIKKGSTGNIVLYAKWKANRYTIRFKGNGATSGKMSDLKNRKYGKTYKLTGNKFKRKGYSFLGWNTKASGKGKAYPNRASVKNLTVKNKKVVNLYAQWGIKEYTITYVLNGGTNNAKNPSTYTVKSKNIELRPAKKKGHTFAGWYKEKTFDHKVSMIPRGSTGDRVLYAKWEVNRYKIRFDKNGATSGSMDDMKGCKYGKSYRLYRNEYKRTGYIFTEWNTKADGSGKSYADRQSVKNLTTKDDVTITLYAQWEPIKYTIEFDGNGSSSGKMDSIDCTYGYSYTLPENTFVRKKFKFDCWNTKSDGSGTSYADKAQVANLATIDGDRITLYAQWDEDFTEIPMNVSKPSQNDISWYISSHPYSNSDVYSLAPSFMEPFREGTLSVQSQTNSLNLLNTYRYIAGIHTNVSINDTYSSHAAKGALILRMNGAMSRDPARPTVLSDPKYDQLYADGKDGCKRSILADGNPSLSMRSAFDMWMSDSDQNNIRMVGHRRWILYPSLSQVGFGKADTGTGAGGSYCAAYVIPGESTTTSSTRVAWPANNTPTGFFKDGTPWSMSLGRTISSSEVKVKVIRDKDNKVWKFTASSSDGDFYVSNDGCGTPGCIIFRPKDLEVKSDESYTVKIFLYDREEMIKYKVNFFSL